MSRKALLLVAGALVASAHPASATALTGSELRASYLPMAQDLRSSPFRRPMQLRSSEAQGRASGEVHAVIEHSLAATIAGLASADQWCELILLSINTKFCKARTASGSTTLDVAIGKKTQQELNEVPHMALRFDSSASTADHLSVILSAPEGPLGTSDYQIQLQAVALPGSRSFLRFSYSYKVSAVARLAVQTYLMTIGSGKVGFTQLGTAANGEPRYIAGIRGLTERNTMRYYLAIDSYLGSMSAPPGDRLENRLQGWFSAIEQYPRQLHDLDRNDYLIMKRAESARQAAAR